MFTFTKICSLGLPYLGAQIRCAQNQSTTSQIDLKHTPTPDRSYKLSANFIVCFGVLLLTGSVHFASNIKGALSGLRQFLAIESLLKMIKNAFYFTSKPLFVLRDI